MNKLDSELFAVIKNGKLSASSRVKKIRELVQKGASVDARGEYGFTPLHDSVEPRISYIQGSIHPEPEIIECLVKLGASVSVANEIGITPLERAICANSNDLESSRRSREILGLLAKLGATGKASFSHFVCADPSLYEFLLTLGGDPGFQDEEGNSALHMAVIAQRPEIVKLLLDRDVNLNAPNHLGKTPLGLATKKQAHTSDQKKIKGEILDLLARRGAKEKVEIQKSDSTTPVDSGGLSKALRQTGLDESLVAFFKQTFDTYQELIVELTKTLPPDHFVPALEVCKKALGRKKSVRVLAGDAEINTPFFHHGDLHVEGSLYVTAPLAVTGSLKVKGYLRDCGPESKVIVGGDVSLHSLHTSGEFHVGGDIDATGIVYGYYNDNTLSASKIFARLVIEDEHSVEATVESPHHFDIDRYAQGYGKGVLEELQNLLVPDVFTAEDGGPSVLNADILFERLKNGTPIFLDEG